MKLNSEYQDRNAQGLTLELTFSIPGTSIAWSPANPCERKLHPEIP